MVVTSLAAAACAHHNESVVMTIQRLRTEDWKLQNLQAGICSLSAKPSFGFEEALPEMAPLLSFDPTGQQLFTKCCYDIWTMSLPSDAHNLAREVRSDYQSSTAMPCS